MAVVLKGGSDAAVGTASDQDERRGHVRYKVDEPCRATVDGQEYRGRVVNLSVVGAAVHTNVEFEEEPPAWKPMELFIERIGRIQTNVVRPLIGGVAVEFTLDRDKDRDLIDTLWRVLDEYAAQHADLA